MHKKAFSLAELMIVMLILTIILAATMPILSKRAKVKAAAAAASSSKSCIKVVNSSFDTGATGLQNDISLLYYTMIGGGGGGGIRSYCSLGAVGGGGGSSAILVDGTLQALAKGGYGGQYGGFMGYYLYQDGNNGQANAGTISNLNHGQRLTIYAGGGGSGAACVEYSAIRSSYGGKLQIDGAGGAGYFGGDNGYTYGVGGVTSQSYFCNNYTIPSSGMCGSSFNGGNYYYQDPDVYPNNLHLCANGGQQSNDGPANTTDSFCLGAHISGLKGGGGYGHPGGDGYNTGSQQGNSVLGNGQGGQGDIYCYGNGSSCWVYGKGGNGGSVTLFYTTTAPSCFL